MHVVGPIPTPMPPSESEKRSGPRPGHAPRVRLAIPIGCLAGLSRLFLAPAFSSIPPLRVARRLHVAPGNAGIPPARVRSSSFSLSSNSFRSFGFVSDFVLRISGFQRPGGTPALPGCFRPRDRAAFRIDVECGCLPSLFSGKPASRPFADNRLHVAPGNAGVPLARVRSSSFSLSSNFVSIIRIGFGFRVSNLGLEIRA
jgi:hypothetical protein